MKKHRLTAVLRAVCLVCQIEFHAVKGIHNDAETKDDKHSIHIRFLLKNLLYIRVHLLYHYYTVIMG